MSKPEIRVNAGIYDLIWREEQVGIRVDRLRNHSDNLSGEITVKTLLPGVAPHLHQARLNLTSTSARRTLANHLVGRLAELDWDGIIEDACVLVLRAYREGEPVLCLKDVAPRTGPRYRLAPLLLEGHPNYLYDDGGTGKSLLAGFFGVLVSSGCQWCGLTTMPGNVLYLDYETSAEEMRERIAAIEKGLADPGCSRIQYRLCVAPLANDIEEIQRIVSEQEIEFVIVDSAGMALGGEKGDPKDPVIEYFRALRSLRICSLTIDHITKGEGGRKLPYGSVYKFNLARNVFEMRKAQEAGDDDMHVGLYHRKANFGKLLPPIGFKLALHDAPDGSLVSVTLEPAKVRDVPSLAEGMGVKDRILAFLLSEGSGTVAEIAAALDMTATMIRARLNDGRGKCFTQVGEGREPKWAALSRENEENR
jgi:hypothetical protein